MTVPLLPIPPAPRHDVVDVLHGVEVADPYRWLEDGDAPATVEWVLAQNLRTRTALDGRPDRAAWHARITRHLGRDVVLAASARGGVLVTLERPTGAPQARLVARRPDDPDPDAEPAGVVLVDPGVTADDSAVAVDWFHVSPDGSLVAYGTSEGGTEHSVLRVVRTSDASHLTDEVPDTRACSLAWEPDATGFFYTRYPEHHEYDRTVHAHRLGDDWRDDPVVWTASPDPQTWAQVDLSPDGSLLVVTAMLHWGCDEVHVLDRRTQQWRTVVEGVEARTSVVFGPGDAVHASTTVDAPNGRLVRIPLDDEVAGPATWIDVIPERAVVLGVAVVAGDDLVVPVTRRATDLLERWSLVGPDAPHLVGPVEDLGVVTVDALTADPTTGRVFVVTSGYDAPGAVRALDGTSSMSLDGTFPVPVGGPDLVVEEVEYTSTDGATVGMFLVRRRDVHPDPSTPTILTGYGGFAISSTPAWSPLAAAWCEAGGLYAVAGIRGGLEHGDAWHRAGKRANKLQVFADFAAAADWLVDTGRTDRAHLAIAGGSNGGLLVGAALTRRPDLCRAVWCAVPLLDMIRFPQFLIAKLWTEEYGDPDVAEEFEWLRAYSPYHHVRPGECYPAVLLTTAEGDSRVDPLHARKMAAALQGATSCGDDHPVLLHQQERAGHGVGKPVGKRADELADVAAFVAWQMGGLVPVGE